MFEMTMEPLIKDNENNVWNDYVPIIKKGNTYEVYLTNMIDAPNFYNELIDLLGNLEEYNTVVLNINNGGGHVDSAFMLVDAIKMSEAEVIAKVSGTVASAATIITLACDGVITTKYLAFMIHNYSTGMEGKGHELKAYQTFTDRELNRAFKEIYKGFLTDKEMEDVIDGKDIWLNEYEVSERWENKIEYNNKGN